MVTKSLLSVICPEELYTYYDKFQEIRPLEPSIEFIINTLKNETTEEYFIQIKCLYDLFNSGLFQVSRLVSDFKKMYLELKAEFEVKPESDVESDSEEKPYKKYLSM